MALSNQEKNFLLNYIFCQQTETASRACYIGLSTTAPQADGSGITEPSGSGYSRVIIGDTHNISNRKMGIETTGTITNTLAIRFPRATAAWGSFSYYCIFDAAAGGNMLYYGSITTPLVIGANQYGKIAVGSLQLSVE